MSKREKVVEQALALSPDDRAYLADVLEQSLVNAELSNSTLATAWTREIDRRLAALEAGEVEEIDLETALKEVREELEAERTKSTP